DSNKSFYLQSKIINSSTIMYNEENTPKIYNNIYTEYNAIFSQSQTNISLLNVYNHSSKEWSEDFTQNHENQSNNNQPTEWSPDFTKNQTNMSLLNVYNNPFVEWLADYEDQTNSNLFAEWVTDFTQNGLHTLLENQINNAEITQDYEEQINSLQQ
ncbi:46295_t:CDS:2, partial [Gigaspora margarita]